MHESIAELLLGLTPPPEKENSRGEPHHMFYLKMREKNKVVGRAKLSSLWPENVQAQQPWTIFVTTNFLFDSKK